MSQWQALTPYGAPQPGAPTSGGQGGFLSSGLVATRDSLDQARMGGRTPEADYPDGYLGTIRSRREDRLLDAVKQKIGDRSYQRGVHKGIQIDAGDYFWPDELRADRGVRLESQARKVNGYVYRSVRPNPVQTTTEQIIYGQRGRLPRGAESLIGQPLPGELSERAPQLAKLLPSWR